MFNKNNKNSTDISKIVQTAENADAGQDNVSSDLKKYHKTMSSYYGLVYGVLALWGIASMTCCEGKRSSSTQSSNEISEIRVLDSILHRQYNEINMSNASLKDKLIQKDSIEKLYAFRVQGIRDTYEENGLLTDR